MPAVTVPVKARNRVQWVLGEQTYLPALARRRGIDLLHSLASTAPAQGPFRRVTTVHDLIYRRYPDAHFGIRDRGMRVAVELAVRRSDRVIAISRSTRDDLYTFLHTPPDKIDVVLQGLGAIRRAEPPPESHTRERFELGERPLILSLSAKRPHKNLLVLIDALGLIDARERPVLVLAGYPTEHERELRARVQELGLRDDVRIEGWLPDAEVEGLWAVAAGFVYPSLWEGFGLPVLEAMARGVAVACSKASSLPEVSGGHALLFEPDDSRAIADAIVQLVRGGPEIERLRRSGRHHAATFTWERTARQTLASYERALAAWRASSAAAARS